MWKRLFGEHDTDDEPVEPRPRFEPCYIDSPGIRFEMAHRHDIGGCAACEILRLRRELIAAHAELAKVRGEDTRP